MSRNHGSAAWGAKQLDSEIAQSFWLTVPISRELIFETAAEDMWEKAILRMGVDPKNLHGGPSSRTLN